jgi:hypothetical protein
MRDQQNGDHSHPDTSSRSRAGKVYRMEMLCRYIRYVYMNKRRLHAPRFSRPHLSFCGVGSKMNNPGHLQSLAIVGPWGQPSDADCRRWASGRRAGPICPSLPLSKSPVHVAKRDQRLSRRKSRYWGRQPTTIATSNHCAAVDGVSRELFSAPNSLLTGRDTGNFASSR